MSEHNHEFTGGSGRGRGVSKFRTAASFINHRLTDVLLERENEKKEKKARAGDRNLPRNLAHVFIVLLDHRSFNFNRASMCLDLDYA